MKRKHAFTLVVFSPRLINIHIMLDLVFDVQIAKHVVDVIHIVIVDIIIFCVLPYWWKTVKQPVLSAIAT